MAELHRRYVRTLALTATPSLVVAAVLRLPLAAGIALSILGVLALASPDETKEGFREGLKGVVLSGLLALSMGLVAAGLALLAVGAACGAFWMVFAGAGAGVAGGGLGKRLVASLRPRSVLPPPPMEKFHRPPPLPLPPQAVVELAGAAPAPASRDSPPPKRHPRAVVEWGGRLFPAYQTDECGYAISGPPGRAKTTLLMHFLSPIVKEVIDPTCNSTLILIDPKRELYPWIASQWPQDSPAPLELFCPSDKRTVTLDWDLDFPSMSAAEIFALSMFPEDLNVSQPFFGNASRTAVEGCITAIRSKLGRWDLRTLCLVMSNPGYMKKLIGGDRATRFIAELLSAKSGETAQNVQMEVTSKISKWRKVAAHLDRVGPGGKLSLDHFLGGPGALVIQREEGFERQHNSMNAMLLRRIGQILMSKPEDPARKRKIYIVVDEFPSLGYIEGLDTMCRELRSRGVVFCFVWQSWANVKAVWKERADTIQGVLQNFMMLSSADLTDAKHCAELIGKERGYENVPTVGRASGVNSGRTQGESDNDGWGVTMTDAAGWFPPQGFTKTRAKSNSGGRSKSRSASEGEFEQENESVTRQYFDRDLVSQTELRRIPLPSKEDGILGVAYRAGEPSAWPFSYPEDLIKSVRKIINRFIPVDSSWPTHYEVIREFSAWELARLGLDGVAPEDHDAYPTQEEAERMKNEATASPPSPEAAVEEFLEMIDAADGDWDGDEDGAGDPDPADHEPKDGGPA